MRIQSATPSRPTTATDRAGIANRPRPGVVVVIAPLLALLGFLATSCSNELTNVAATAYETNSILSTNGRANILFQANCAACHGRYGLGNGRAAIAVNVAPRNFWIEPFRYISSLDLMPTREDVIQTIRGGRVGVGGHMPAGTTLPDGDVQLLADFVIELRRLGIVDELRRELADNDRITPEIINEISRERLLAPRSVDISPPGPGFRADTVIGRNLFASNCASCHGSTGKGDGLEMPLDELGRPISVRDLTSGEFRGGSEPIELFKRIRCGIPGTPMPLNTALSDDETWQLVHYCLFLAGVPIGR